MREIKFRGRCLDNNTQTGPADGWVTGFYYQGLCEGEVRHFIASCPCVWEVDPATVGQYTGLKDKNGKEIWEGDIVMAEALDEYEDNMLAGWPFLIIFSYGAFCIAEDEESPWAQIDSLKNMEVIGNIHDNPELLKGGEQ
ncbi:YopX family protein [Alistipes putredinis]|uniref:YopX family protein n=1 Tax=Alistipes putredinis TaxID=28117 RepID=UPI002AC347FE|nr:YopX family protein [Alistipes putredinis]